MNGCELDICKKWRKIKQKTLIPKLIGSKYYVKL